jgi:hypothetical protein
MVLTPAVAGVIRAELKTDRRSSAARRPSLRLAAAGFGPNPTKK